MVRDKPHPPRLNLNLASHSTSLSSSRQQSTPDESNESLNDVYLASSSSSNSSLAQTPTSLELVENTPQLDVPNLGSPAVHTTTATTTTTLQVPHETQPSSLDKLALSPQSPLHLGFPRNPKRHQKVRFPAGNNPLSKKIHLPDDDNDYGHELVLEALDAAETTSKLRRLPTRQGSIFPNLRPSISDEESDDDQIKGGPKGPYNDRQNSARFTERTTLINTLKNRGNFMDSEEDENDEEEEDREEFVPNHGTNPYSNNRNFTPISQDKGKQRWSGTDILADTEFQYFHPTDDMDINTNPGSFYFDTGPEQASSTSLSGSESSDSFLKPTAAFAAAATINQNGQMIGNMLKYSNLGGGGLVPGPGTIDSYNQKSTTKNSSAGVDSRNDQMSQKLIDYNRKLLLSQSLNIPLSRSDDSYKNMPPQSDSKPFSSTNNGTLAPKAPHIVAFATNGDSKTIYHPELSRNHSLIPSSPALSELNQSIGALTKNHENEEHEANTADTISPSEVSSRFQSEAEKLVRSHTRKLFRSRKVTRRNPRAETTQTPDSSNELSRLDYFSSDRHHPSSLSGEDHHSSFDGDIESQSGTRNGISNSVLGNLLKLYGNNNDSYESSQASNSTAPSLISIGDESGVPSPTSSATSQPTTPSLLSPANSGFFPQSRPGLGKKARSISNMLTSKIVDEPEWYQHKRQRSAFSSNSMPSSSIPSPNSLDGAATDAPSRVSRPKFYKRNSGGKNGNGSGGSSSDAKKAAKLRKQLNREERIRITVHIAEVLQRQKFILRMCRCIMLFGVPTHRLEEYMRRIAYILEIDCYFIYLPGCMIVSFGDSTTHTSEMRLVRCQQGVNLSKLIDIHIIYKEVIHDIISVEEAFPRIDLLLKSNNCYSPWWCVLLFGTSSAVVTAGFFNGNWLDISMGLVFGSLVGTLQIIVAPKSDLYNNIFEVSCAILVSFLSRALGSIKNGKYFCYTAIVQGSITLILPGYVILCGSLEIQSKNIVSGAVRMIYAIVYSLFLGFGISVGATIYGLIDSNAVSVADGNSLCNKSPLSPWFGFLFVPVFVVGIALVNQARWMQIPAMIIIASAGYAVTYFVDQKFPDSAQLTSAIGAFVIGILGNIHSRLTHGLGFAAMLPAIFILIPFCLASQGSIINGIQAGNGNSTHDLYTTMSLGSGMLNISVGLTVGLFSAALVVYPAGKKRSGLFTF